jgi:hypothetical protein
MPSDGRTVSVRVTGGYDGVHLWCQRGAIGVVFPCGARGAHIKLQLISSELDIQ